MITALDRLRELGLTLPPPPAKGGLYTPVRKVGNLLFVSGVGASEIDGVQYLGKVGRDLTPAQAEKLAELSALNLLAVVQANVGLEHVVSIVKLYGMVQSADGFCMQPQVIDGASRLFNKVFPESTGHVRMAVGTSQLPGNLPVEMEAIFELRT